LFLQHPPRHGHPCGGTFRNRLAAAIRPSKERTLKTSIIKSEITGTVWKIVSRVGDAVAEHQDLVILESMKMEIPASSPESGTVREILVKEGDLVKEGQVLVVVEQG
jgi:acetyl-CoA carboxylase biotin carboxyl carrier protein